MGFKAASQLKTKTFQNNLEHQLQTHDFPNSLRSISCLGYIWIRCMKSKDFCRKQQLVDDGNKCDGNNWAYTGAIKSVPKACFTTKTVIALSIEP